MTDDNQTPDELEQANMSDTQSMSEPSAETTTESKDWRAELAAWLLQHSKTIPPNLRELREEFVHRFPKERLGDLTLEEYALGHEGTRDSFCYWLERKTRYLGSILGGNVTKFGVWYNKDSGWRWVSRYESAEDALAQIKTGLSAMMQAVEDDHYDMLDKIGGKYLGYSYSLRCKPLNLYFPDEFLPIYTLKGLAHFAKLFDLKLEGEIVERNRQLLHRLKQYPEFAGFDTHQLMGFLYQCFPPPEETQGEAVAPRPPALATQLPDLAPELQRLMDMTTRTRNVLLYGPPGTGKTWLVNHFTNYFLLRHNVAREQADEYWRAIVDKDRARQQALSARARGETAESEQQFWWLNANEEEWDWEQLFARGEWCFGKRHPPQNFAAAKRGDLIFGYFARPHSQIVCTAYVAGELAWREFDGERKECVVIKPGARLAHPLDWGKVSENEVLNNSAVVRTNARGSMHALSHEEARELLRLINAEGNDVRPLPRGGYTEFVTFHQSFAYEEFVEGLKPVLLADEQDADLTTTRSASESPAAVRDSGQEIGYKIQPGVFRRICARAAAAWRVYGDAAPKYLLVIDEINRANIAKVLGELITLLEDDKRLGEENALTVRLPYSGARFGVPPNLYLLGTLNTADRSIALLDLALRRRFTFVEMMPRGEVISPPEIEGVNLPALLKTLNERISALRDPDHQIGHSYFMNLQDEGDLRFTWYRRIVPLLQEYFYNDGERLRAVLGNDFTRPVSFQPPKGAAWGELYEADRQRYEIKDLNGAEFLAALRKLAGATGGDEAMPEETAAIP